MPTDTRTTDELLEAGKPWQMGVRWSSYRGQWIAFYLRGGYQHEETWANTKEHALALALEAARKQEAADAGPTP